MTTNYETKRFLMDCGMNWRDTYLEYLPEEILQYIYKMVFNHSVLQINEYCPISKCYEKDDFRTYNRWLKEIPAKPHKKLGFLNELTIPMTDLFPYGFGNGYTQIDLKTKVEFTNHYCAYEQTNKESMIRDYDFMIINGKKFMGMSSPYDYVCGRNEEVTWYRRTIKEGNLKYYFGNEDLGWVVMENVTKITKKTNNVEFKLTIIPYKEGNIKMQPRGKVAEDRSNWNQFHYSLENIIDVSFPSFKSPLDNSFVDSDSDSED